MTLNLIVFASLKHISIPKLSLMMTIRKYMDAIFLEKIIHLAVNMGESLLVVKTQYHLKLLM